MKSYIKKFRLKNKVACILGGTGLIGKEIVKAVSDAGATTLIMDIDQSKGYLLEEKITKYGNTAKFISFDTVDLANINNTLEQIKSKYGSIDIFVNCSYPRTKDWVTNNFNKIKLDSFSKNIDMHMKSYAWSAKEIAEIMSGQEDGGSIILLSSIYGVLGQDLTIYEDTTMTENMTYALMKGGITNLVRQMASYYGKYNIRVNTLCPGGVFDNQNPTFVKNYSAKTPLKRMAKPEEIASTALFLSSEASAYITGATIMVDGGWSAI